LNIGSLALASAFCLSGDPFLHRAGESGIFVKKYSLIPSLTDKVSFLS